MIIDVVTTANFLLRFLNMGNCFKTSKNENSDATIANQQSPLPSDPQPIPQKQSELQQGEGECSSPMPSDEKPISNR
jgi:hypothetical protein